MGVKRLKNKARVHCAGGSSIAAGIETDKLPGSCKERKALYPEGYLDCKQGCLGAGDCTRACKFDSIVFGPRGATQIVTEKCKGCGMCVKACPQELISLAPEMNYIYVRCSNCDKGPAARKLCSHSCIACGACERNCPAGAIHVVNNIAKINDELCIACGMCARVCPRGAIVDTQGIVHVAD